MIDGSLNLDSISEYIQVNIQLIPPLKVCVQHMLHHYRLRSRKGPRPALTEAHLIEFIHFSHMSEFVNST